MKEKMKRALLAFMTVFCIGLLAACSREEAAEPIDAQTLTVVETAAENLVLGLDAMPADQLDEAIAAFEDEQMTVYSSGFTSFRNSKEALGAYVSTNSVETERTKDGGYRTAMNMSFENRDCDVVIAVDKKIENPTEITFSPVYSMGELMSQAAGNLVVGMGTVFAVLTFIMLIIGMFRFIPQDLGQKKKAGAPKAEEAAPAVSAAAAATASSEDEEIQAVIAAAIAAYEAENKAQGGAPLANGLRVRSVRRTANVQRRR